MVRNLIAAILLSFIVGCQSHSAPPASSADGRADALIRKMTPDEKIDLLGGDVDEYSTRAIPRVGIPKLIMADGPQGIRNYPPSCSFPCGAALAATWDTSLAAAYGTAMGLEARARGVNFVLGPGMNINRVPVNGRNFEYFGEDPLLAAKIAVNWVRAAQAQGIIVTVKHFAANNQEWNRDSVDEQIDPRTLHEIYLPAFRAAITQGGAKAIMAAYNRVNGQYCAENTVLLQQVLRGQWKFQGIVMSDWGACHSPESLARGLDLEMGRTVFFTRDRMKQALDAQLVTQGEIDRADHRILRTAIASGFFDRPQKRDDLPLDSPASDRTALEIARSAIVLLKNDGAVLPLNRTAIHRIAVYGPNAVDTPNGGSGAVHPFHNISFFQGIKAAAGPGVEVSYTPMAPADDKLFAQFPGAFTADNGQPGLLLTIVTHNHGKDVTLPATVVHSVDLSWRPSQLPIVTSKAESADFTWSGVIKAPSDGDWELVSKGYIDVTVDGKDLLWRTGSVLHLKQGRSLPIQIHMWDRISRRKPRPGEPPLHVAQVTLRPVEMPDLSAAKSADAVVVCAGFNGDSEHEGHDRDFNLSGMQQQLIQALESANPHTIVVLNSGAGVGMENWLGGAPALLQAWYIGQDGGTALGEVLFGDVNPSGRLPCTFDRTFEDNPAFANYPGHMVREMDRPVENYAEGIFVGYRGYDKAHKEPLFPFGFGLSYTSFDFANLKLARTGDGMNVSVDVSNTGHVAGAEVVQIYVGQQHCSVERPVRELKGFVKVFLQPGETQTVQIPLGRDAFEFWSPIKKDWTIEPDDFTVEAAASSRDIRCTQTIKFP